MEIYLKTWQKIVIPVIFWGTLILIGLVYLNRNPIQPDYSSTYEEQNGQFVNNEVGHPLWTY